MIRRYTTLGAALAALFVLPVLAHAESTPATDAAKATTKMEAKKEAMMKERASAAFSEADTNKDGSLSLDEFLARHKQKFSEIDADKNGSLTPEELKAHGDERREHWKQRKEGMKDKGGEPPMEKPPVE